MATTELTRTATESLRVCSLSDAPAAALGALLSRQELVSRARFGAPLAEAVSRLRVAIGGETVDGYYVDSPTGKGYVAIARFPDADVVGSLWTSPGRPDLAPVLLAPVRERCLREGRRLEAQDLTFGEDALSTVLAPELGLFRERSYLRATIARRPDSDASRSTESIRVMGPADVLSCAAVATRAFAVSADLELSRSYASFAGNQERLALAFQGDSWGERIPESSVVALDARGCAVGFALVTALGARVAHLFEMAVVPEARGRGVGALLLSHAMQACRHRGIRQMTLSVTSTNRSARRLYERFGFVEERAFRAYVLEGGEEGVPSRTGKDGPPARTFLPGADGPTLRTPPQAPVERFHRWHPPC